MYKRNTEDFKLEDYLNDINEFLDNILEYFLPINFHEICGISEKELKNYHYHVVSVDKINEIFISKKIKLFKNFDSFDLSNNIGWVRISNETLKFFLGKISEKFGVSHFTSMNSTFLNNLYKQFLCTNRLSKEEVSYIYK